MRDPLLARSRTTLLLIIIAAGVCALPVAARDVDPARLERLAVELDALRERAHVPGCSIAVVIGDEVVFARGFGLRDVGAGKPATDETIYAIGSVTKSFTAGLLATLVDDGRVGWDDPVRRHLPDFALADDALTELVTIRDLLSHRTGLLGTDLMWASGQAGWPEISAALARAEPVSPLRAAFHYQNVCFLVAGRVAAAAGGADYATLLRTRLLDPLGMDAAWLSITDVAGAEHLALGYTWDADAGAPTQVPMRNLDNIAPAGAINANVRDMARWIRLQLGRGEIDGRRVIAAPQFDGQMWDGQIAMGDRQYGLGWFLRTWEGKRLVEHGGNIDGFSAQAAFLPDDGVGFVLLSNVSASGLQAGSIDLVFRALLGDAAPVAPGPTEDAADLDRFAGRYHFDALGDDVTVLVRDGELGLDVPGQMVYELLSPDDEGRRAFRGFEAITVRFNEDDAGAIVSITLDQAGVVFELPRAGVEIPEEIAADVARPYLGRYRSAAMQMEIEVLRHRGRLAVDVPEQMVYDLHPPDDEGRWRFRASDAISVRFERNDDGAVIAVTMNQSGLDMRFDRTTPPPPPDADAPTLPTAIELMRIVHEQRGRDAYEQLLNLRLDGTIEFRHQGIAGTITTLVSGFDRFWQRMDFGIFGWIQTSCIGNEGWRQAAFEPLAELSGPLLAQLRLGHPALVLDWWPDVFATITVAAAEPENGRPAVLVCAEPADLPATEFFIDVADGRVLRSEGGVRLPGGGTMSVKTRYEDYREIAGVWLPFRSITRTDVYGEVVVQIETARPDIELTREPWFMNLPEGAAGPLD